MKKSILELAAAWAVLFMIAVVAGCPATGTAQHGTNGKARPAAEAQAFTFVRVAWQGLRIGSGLGRGPMWAHDYPTAEQNLYTALEAMTSLPLTFENKILRLDSEEIFDLPFLYICEVGYWVPSAKESEALREYLQRGGFLIVDDFRGGFEWRHFLKQMREIVEWPPRKLALDHPIFHCFFDFEQLGDHAPYWGLVPVHYAIYDDKDRMVAVINYNNDIGDGWEWPDSDVEFSTEAFKLGINYLIYSMTH